jgi:hypothetical protein
MYDGLQLFVGSLIGSFLGSIAYNHLFKPHRRTFKEAVDDAVIRSIDNVGKKPEEKK